MNKLKLLLIASVLSLFGCSSDESITVNEPNEPITQSGQGFLEARINESSSWGYGEVHIRIRKLLPSGQWIAVQMPHVNGAEWSNAAIVNPGDHLKIIYDNGIGANQCCITYKINKSSGIVTQTDSACRTNTEPFATFFEFDVQ